MHISLFSSPLELLEHNKTLFPPKLIRYQIYNYITNLNEFIYPPNRSPENSADHLSNRSSSINWFFVRNRRLINRSTRHYDYISDRARVIHPWGGLVTRRVMKPQNANVRRFRVVWYFRLEKRWKYHEWANQLSWRRGWGGKNIVTGPPSPMRPLSFPRFLVSETIHSRVRKILSVVSNLESRFKINRIEVDEYLLRIFFDLDDFFKHCFFRRGIIFSPSILENY